MNAKADVTGKSRDDDFSVLSGRVRPVLPSSADIHGSVSRSALVPTTDNLSSLLYLPASLLGMTMDLTVVGGHRHGRRNIRIRRQGTAALRPKLGTAAV